VVSNRYRATQNIGNKLNNLSAKVGRVEKKHPTFSLPDEASDAAREATTKSSVGTNQLGVVNEIVSDSNMLLNFPADSGVQVAGGVYEEAALEGGYSPVVVDSNGVLRPYPADNMRAILDPAYRGEGPARLTFAGSSTLSVESYDWVVPYVPWGSRVVNVEWRGGAWKIVGQSAEQGYGGRHGLALQGDWVSYNERNGEDGWRNPTAVRLHSGIVVLSGLVNYGLSAVPPSQNVIAVLPEHMRPENNYIFPVSQSDTAKAVEIKTNGDIVSRAGWTSGGYVSLDGIAFPAAGVATWTDVGSSSSTVLGSSWEIQSGDTAIFGHPGFWTDPYGFTWFRGLLRVKTAISTDNTLMFTLPTAARSHLEAHNRSAANDGYAGIGARTIDGLNWKSGSTGSVGAWFTLAPVVLATPAAISDNPWYEIEYFGAAWAADSASFPTIGFLRREDGLCMSKGMMQSGTLGTGRAFTLPQELWPRDGRAIIDTIANNARARVDVSGATETDSLRKRGGFSAVNGSNTWFSLDGLKWTNG
jgi:hypothetical protein